MQVAQENSFDSIIGVERDGADGFEVDVFLTDDDKLVCFHDQNTLVSIENLYESLAVVISKRFGALGIASQTSLYVQRCRF